MTERRAVCRVVLDTNVALDLLLFGDRDCAALADALGEGSVTWIASPESRNEFARVLEYPSVRRFIERHGLPPGAAASALACYDRFVGQAAPVDRPPAVPLPRCADPDDQFLLALAAEADARFLLSKDKELLRLAGKVRRQLPDLVICPPCRFGVAPLV
jgi:putative PIN family toxin of toxin-antitoxin system